MFGLIKSRQEKKRREEREKELKQALAKRFENFDGDLFSSDVNDITDYTIVNIGGELLRVAKQHITIFDVDAPSLQV